MTQFSEAFLNLEKSHMKKAEKEYDKFEKWFDETYSQDVGCLYHKRMARAAFEFGREFEILDQQMPEEQEAIR